MFLRDEDLVNNKGWFDGLEVPSDPYVEGSPLQAGSVDLSIGNIYLPETPPGDEGGADNPSSEYQLPAGATAVIETKEVIRFPSDVAAFGFPPARVSSKGLLMTNPGHVDPGYWGTLRFTVINMGRQGFELKSGDPIVTLLVFRLSETPKANWRARRKQWLPSRRVPAATLNRLSRDFLDVSRRAEKIVRDAEVTSKRIGLYVPFATALGGVVVALIALLSPPGEARIQTVESKVDKVEARLQQADLDARLKTLESQVAELLGRGK